jgi:hypothetical protein
MAGDGRVFTSKACRYLELKHIGHQAKACRHLDAGDLLFFCFAEVVDLCDVGVGEFLDLV